MSRSYDHVLSFALEHPWAITASMTEVIAGILARRLAGEDTDARELAALVNRKNLPQPVRGGVALIPIYGVIAPRMNLMSEMSGGTTFEALTAQLSAAVENPEVATIVFDVDSPGGNVAGASEFAREVLRARTKKPIVAQAHHLMASAAYWPMAAATEIVASPSAMVGSIGVYTIHEDISEALAKHGVKRTVFSAGKYKAEGADEGALSAEAAAHIAGIVESAYGRMVNDIAAGRGVKAAAIRGGYGEGRAVPADVALELGMVDRIGTLADTLARLTKPTSAGAFRAAQPAAALDSMHVPAVTDQEPVTATSQEPRTDVAWQNAIECGLLELDL